MLENIRYIFISKGTVALFSIVFMAIMARSLEKEEFAIIAIFEMVSLLVSTLSSFGLETYLINRLPSLVQGSKLQTARLIAQSVISGKAVFSSVILAIALLSYFFLFDGYPIDLDVLILLALAVWLQGINNSLLIFMQASLRIKDVAFIDVFFGLSSKLVYTPLMVYLGFMGYVYGLALACLVYCVYLTRINNIRLFDFDFNLYWLMVKRSFPFYLSSINRFLQLQGDQLVVAALLSSDLIAGYALSKRIISYFKIILDSFSTPFTLKLSQVKTQPTKLEQYALLGSQANSYFLLPVLVVMSVLSELLVLLIGGGEYQAYSSILALMVLGKAFFVFTTFLSNISFSYFSPVIFSKMEIVSSIVGVMLGWLALASLDADLLGLNYFFTGISIFLVFSFLLVRVKAIWIVKWLRKIAPILFVNIVMVVVGHILLIYYSVYLVLVIGLFLIPFYFIYLYFDLELRKFIFRGFDVK